VDLLSVGDDFQTAGSSWNSGSSNIGFWVGSSNELLGVVHVLAVSSRSTVFNANIKLLFCIEFHLVEALWGFAWSLSHFLL
jgi:hypothetical protein